MNTLSRHDNPSAAEPARDDDPTGVRDLLSSLPEPEPMPRDLVERINASLAAEQAARATTFLGASAVPLRATSRRRRARLLLATFGVAAAFAVIAVLGSSLLTARQTSTTSSSAAVTSSSGSGRDSGGAPLSAPAKTPDSPEAAASLIQIRLSGTRYTEAGFVTQAAMLRRATAAPFQPQPTQSSELGTAGTDTGLRACLVALGAGAAQEVRADVAFYEGQPAVIVVAVTNGVPTAYAVGRQCSRTDAAVLRPATPLP